MRDLLLGIDVGTTAAKAVLFTLDGRLQALGQADYPLATPFLNAAEQSPEDWWQAVCRAIRQALTAVPDAANRVIGLAISSQAPTLLPLDRNGQPLRPALIWMDRRADAQVEQLKQALGAETIFAVTGNRADSFFLAAKFRWFQQHEAHLLARTHQFLQVNGYIAYRLAGVYSLDPAHAALMGLQDRATGTWSRDLLALCGLDPAQFPPIAAGHQIIGEVTATAALATGLRPGTWVMTGSIDGTAAALEAGAIAPGTAAEMTGTSTVLLMPNAQGITDPALISIPHVVPGQHLLIGATVASGAALKWFRDTLGSEEVAAASRLDRDVFDLLTEQAEVVAPGSGGVIFLPYLLGERSPLWLTEARGVFFGLTLATPRAALIRAILEGTSFALRHNIETARAAGAELHELRSVGGGAKSALWCQIKADVLGVPVALPQAAGGAPFGAALLVALGAGLIPDLASMVRDTVRIERVFEPNTQRHARYSDIYALYRDLSQHLRADFIRAAAVFGTEPHP